MIGLDEGDLSDKLGVTRGFQGMPVPPPDILGHPLSQACSGKYRRRLSA